MQGVLIIVKAPKLIMSSVEGEEGLETRLRVCLIYKCVLMVCNPIFRSVIIVMLYMHALRGGIMCTSFQLDMSKNTHPWLGGKLFHPCTTTPLHNYFISRFRVSI